MANQQSIYLFIDGEYLRRRYTDAMANWFENEMDIDFRILTNTFSARKSFYYDCLDNIKRPNETNDEFNARIEVQNSYFNKIREVPGCHVRLGYLAGSTEKRKRQKEVDVLLAVDMMYHASRENMTKAILIAGDRDFKPVVERLVDLGKDVEVVSDTRSMAKALAWAADSHRLIGFEDYFGWSTESLKTKFPFPDKWTKMMILGGEEQLKRGSASQFRLWLYQAPNTYAIYLKNSQTGEEITYKHKDVDRLQIYVEAIHGEIKWAS